MNASLENTENNNANSNANSNANGGQNGTTGASGSGSGVQNINSNINDNSSVREIIAAAGGVELALSGVMLGSNERTLFFEQEKPEGNNKYFVFSSTHNVLFLSNVLILVDVNFLLFTLFLIIIQQKQKIF